MLDWHALSEWREAVFTYGCPGLRRAPYSRPAPPRVDAVLVSMTRCDWQQFAACGALTFQDGRYAVYRMGKPDGQ